MGNKNRNHKLRQHKTVQLNVVRQLFQFFLQAFHWGETKEIITMPQENKNQLQEIFHVANKHREQLQEHNNSINCRMRGGVRIRGPLA